jgi:hypothetical protein
MGSCPVFTSAASTPKPNPVKAPPAPPATHQPFAQNRTLAVNVAILSKGEFSYI